MAETAAVAAVPSLTNEDDDPSIGSCSSSSDEERPPSRDAPPPVVARQGSIRTGRRATAMAAPVTLPEDWAPPCHAKTDEKAAAIQRALSNIFLFQHLQEKDLAVIVGAMQSVQFAKGATIITQGDVGDRLYIVEEGKCDILVQGVGKVAEAEAGRGDSSSAAARCYFGELSLLYNAPRAATVVAATDVRLWALDRLTFKKISQDTALKQQGLYRGFLEQSLTQGERALLADALSPRTFAAGEAIVREGEEGHEFFIIETGEVVCTRRHPATGHETCVSDPLGVGDYFGELSLLEDANGRRRATVRATKPTVCLALGRETFRRLLGPLESILKARAEEVYARYDSRTDSSIDGLGAAVAATMTLTSSSTDSSSS